MGQSHQYLILRIRERDRIRTFQLDPNRKIIAVATPLEIRLTSMPGPVITGNKLNDTTITPQQAMETLFNKKGIEITRQVLSRFGAQRVRDLTPDQHADFVAKATAVADGREQP